MPMIHAFENYVVAFETQLYYGDGVTLKPWTAKTLNKLSGISQ